MDRTEVKESKSEMDEKLQKPKPKPTKKMTRSEQSERFKETARKLGVDETCAEFERLFATVSRNLHPARGPLIVKAAHSREYLFHPLSLDEALGGAMATGKPPEPKNKRARQPTIPKEKTDESR